MITRKGLFFYTVMCSYCSMAGWSSIVKTMICGLEQSYKHQNRNILEMYQKRI